MFTADPVTGNRAVVSIDASFGLGEALVSGIVSADLYKVRDNKVIAKKIARKKVAVRAIPGGGTEKTPIAVDRQTEPALSDDDAQRIISAIGANGFCR